MASKFDPIIDAAKTGDVEAVREAWSGAGLPENPDDIGFMDKMALGGVLAGLPDGDKGLLAYHMGQPDVAEFLGAGVEQILAVMGNPKPVPPAGAAAPAPAPVAQAPTAEPSIAGRLRSMPGVDASTVRGVSGGPPGASGGSAFDYATGVRNGRRVTIYEAGGKVHAMDVSGSSPRYLGAVSSGGRVQAAPSNAQPPAPSPSPSAQPAQAAPASASTPASPAQTAPAPPASSGAPVPRSVATTTEAGDPSLAQYPGANISAEELQGATSQRPRGQEVSNRVVGGTVATDLEPHQRAFLDAVAGEESAGRYNVRYDGSRTGTTFNSYAEHPRVMETRPDGRKSSAAGRYQFTATTWDRLGGGDFSPENQDRKAWELAQQDYRAQTGGDLDAELRQGGLTPEIVSALSGTWEAFNNGANRHIATYNASLNAPPQLLGTAGNFADFTDQLISAAQSGQSIRRGMTGSDVRAVQAALRARGYDVEVDGQFGPRTEQALKDYQKSTQGSVARAIRDDGVAGPRTLAQLLLDRELMQDQAAPLAGGVDPTGLTGDELPADIAATMPQPFTGPDPMNHRVRTINAAAAFGLGLAGALAPVGPSTAGFQRGGIASPMASLSTGYRTVQSVSSEARPVSDGVAFDPVSIQVQNAITRPHALGGNVSLEEAHREWASSQIASTALARAIRDRNRGTTSRFDAASFSTGGFSRDSNKGGGYRFAPLYDSSSLQPGGGALYDSSSFSGSSGGGSYSPFTGTGSGGGSFTGGTSPSSSQTYSGGSSAYDTTGGFSGGTSPTSSQAFDSSPTSGGSYSSFSSSSSSDFGWSEDGSDWF